jgi:hypothetical protein
MKDTSSPLFDWADVDMRDMNPTRWEARKNVTPPNFVGPNIVTEFDEERLTGQLRDIFNIMKDGEYRTLGEIKRLLGRGSETGISAALRSLRKPQFGSHKVEKRRRGEERNGLWEYALIPKGTKSPV